MTDQGTGSEQRAFMSFSREFMDEAEPKIRSIQFGLCHFHAVMIERKKCGSKGFNSAYCSHAAGCFQNVNCAVMYPFSLGDLRDSAVCLQNYMENSSGKIPWEDLRYIFGEIIYGGHIVNDFDRLMCVTCVHASYTVMRCDEILGVVQLPGALYA